MNPAAAVLVFLLAGTTAFAALRDPHAGNTSVADPSFGSVPASESATDSALDPEPWTGPTLRGSEIVPRPVSRDEPEEVVDEPSDTSVDPLVCLDVVDAETGVPIDCATDVKGFGTVQVWAPRGYVAWDPLPSREAHSGYATRLTATYPLRREALIEATVRECDGTPTVDAGLESATIANRSIAYAEIEAFVSGTYRVRGIPFLRGEALSLTFVPGEQTEGYAPRSTAWKGALPEASAEVLRPVVTLPAPAPLGSGSARALRRGCGGTCGGCEVVEPLAGDGEPQGQVLLTVRRRGGAPASLARIELTALVGADARRRVVDLGTCEFHCLDSDGRLRIAGLTPRRYEVRVEEDGIVPVARDFEVLDGRVTEVTIDEPVGATLDVQVVDAEGRPRKFATVEVHQPSGVMWADLADDGTERLDRFVDHLGRRTLAHVEPGEVRLKATWAGRTVEKTVTVADGEVARVRIDVP